METKNEILDLSFEFALNIIDFAEELESKRKFVIAHQLLKCGTSIGLIFSNLNRQKVKPILFIN